MSKTIKGPMKLTVPMEHALRRFRYGKKNIWDPFRGIRWPTIRALERLGLISVTNVERSYAVLTVIKKRIPDHKSMMRCHACGRRSSVAAWLKHELRCPWAHCYGLYHEGLTKPCH